MIPVTYVLFYLGVGAYALGALYALHYAVGGAKHHLNLSWWAVLSGAVCLVIVFLLRGAQWRLLPMSTPTDTLSLFVVIATVTVFLLLRQPNRLGLMVFYWPPFAIMLLVAAYLAIDDLAHPPKDLATVLVAVHVGLAFLAFALFLVASITSLAYVFQVQHLKRRSTQGLFQKLPSLQQLDHTLYGLIASGYPIFIVTLGIGLWWAYVDTTQLSATWWLSPKVFLAAAMTILYAICFHARTRHFLRGPKLAYLVAGGFAVILVSYLVLDVLRIANYNFWGTG